MGAGFAHGGEHFGGEFMIDVVPLDSGRPWARARLRFELLDSPDTLFVPYFEVWNWLTFNSGGRDVPRPASRIGGTVGLAVRF